MDILVIGGTGFLGRALVSAALAAGAEVYTLNRGRRVAADPVRDTWEWMQRTQDVALGPPGEPPYTLDPAAAARTLARTADD